MIDKQTILVAGATGNLGHRITDALLRRGAQVRALVRPHTAAADAENLSGKGVQIVRADYADAAALKAACQGVSCVVSAVQGLRDVIVDAQQQLLAAAAAAQVPRFIPSDFSCDFTVLSKGENRNFDLRREFEALLNEAPIQATSIFNGAFADILQYAVPLLDRQNKTVGYWENANWGLDFTTMDDTAAFTAAAALDEAAPRKLCIASFQLTPIELSVLMEEITGEKFNIRFMGNLESLAGYNRMERAAHPEGEQQIYPAWQQSQYMHSMFSTHFERLDNHRYPDIQWTTAKTLLLSFKR